MFNFNEKLGLFDDFEVNARPFWPVIGKLLAASLVFHSVVIAAVVFIPPVRDALSIALVFSGGRFVDRPYTKTQIEDNAELMAMTADRFRYPDGYWLIDQGGMPLPTPTPLPFLAQTFKTPESVIIPTPTPSATPSPAIAANADKKPGDQTAQDAAQQEKAQRELEKAAEKNGVDFPEEGAINTKPFKDLALHIDGMKNEGQLDIEQPFEIVIETELDEHGKLANPQIVTKAGDAKLVDLSAQLVAAMNDSGILYYLKAINEDNPKAKVAFRIRQDKTAVVASVESEATSEATARTLVKGFGFAIAYGIKNREGKNEEHLLRSTTVTQDGKKIIFNFAMPRDAVVDMIKKGIAEAAPVGSPS